MTYVSLALIALILCGVIFVFWVSYLRNLRKSRRTRFRKEARALETAVRRPPVQAYDEAMRQFNETMSQLNETLRRGAQLGEVRREERTRLPSGGWELRITTTTTTTSESEGEAPPQEVPKEPPPTIYERLDKDILDED